jgi:transposase
MPVSPGRLPPAMDEAALHELLYKRVVPLSRTPRPDFAYLHAELRRRGVTRLLLWEEYKSAHPDGWQYSVFCEQYRRWLATQELVLRQEHAPGDKLFVDYAGQTVPIKDRHTGKIVRRRSLSPCSAFPTTRTRRRRLARRRRLVRRARSGA